MPRAAFRDRIILIVSMVAQMAASATTGLRKRICVITFPRWCCRPPVVHPSKPESNPAGTSGPADQLAVYPIGEAGKR